MKVAVVGATGMLGAAVAGEALFRGLDVRCLTRTEPIAPWFRGSSWVPFDYPSSSLLESLGDFGEGDFVLNCAGAIPQRTAALEQQEQEYEVVNTILPVQVGRLAADLGFRVVHFTTDCVFAGKGPAYTESSPSDATDTYGVSKSLGEISDERVLNLRTSIIGLGPTVRVSLQDWLLHQPLNSVISGYTNHLWNGVTCAALATGVIALCIADALPGGTRHLVPRDSVSKCELLEMIAEAFHRTDIQINSTASATAVDRRLATEYPLFTKQFWALSGLDSEPSIQEMVEAQVPWYRMRGMGQLLPPSIST